MSGHTPTIDDPPQALSCVNGGFHLDGYKCAPCGHRHCQRCGVCNACRRNERSCTEFQRELPKIVPWQTRRKTLRQRSKGRI
jgi:hypothetical protein